MPVYLPGLTLGGLGYGGAAYGHSAYGSSAFPRLPFATTGGFGGSGFGVNSYGSLDVIPPKVTGASSLDGFRVEVFFSEEMRSNAALVLAGNYLFTAVYGAPLTTVSVALGTAGSYGGYTSVIVTHSGSSLGGQYQATVSSVEDLAGNEISPSPATFSSYGDTTTVTVSLPSPDDGRTVRLDFKDSRSLAQTLLTEAGFSPGVNSTASYAVTTTYPVAPSLVSASQSAVLKSRVDLDVHPMTSATYNLTVGPALSYDYDGSVLPSADPTFTGTVVGTGTSVASASGLILSKAAGTSYGWTFEDTAGRMLPGSSYRADFTFSSVGASIVPALFNSSLVLFAISDGATQVNLLLEDVAGTKVISVTSGALSLQAPAAWDTADAVVSLVRNQKGSFYSVLLNGTPLLTFSIASATGSSTYNAGTAVVLSTPPAVSLFALKGMGLSASSTLFTSAWNFIHGLAVSFTGSSVLAQATIFTKRGPLVRGWGDATPAGKEDVAVRVDGTAVAVSGVNPYVGEIYPTIPIPRTAPGTVTVVADYTWISNPAFGMAGLNTRGLSLNTWDRSVGHTPGAVSPTPSTATGATKTNRFPQGIALGPLTRQSPKRIGHRYIGFQKGYSALLNQPTTLLLNQDPTAVSIGGVSADSLQQTGIFNGGVLPADADTPWTLSGVDTGGLVGDGTYRVIDASSGPYETGTAAAYKRDLDLSLQTSVTSSGRFYLESYVLDGVFTGVGFGVHDGNFLFLVGALLVSGVQHIGVLKDGNNPHLEASWEIGPSALGTATSSTTLTLDTSALPPGVLAGSRFRVASGNQAGVYTIASCGLTASTDGTTVAVTFTPALPADYKGYGNDTFTVLFETLWETNLVSLRGAVEFPAGSATLIMGGAVAGTVVTVAKLAPYPAQTALLLPATEKGVAFWGSVSRRATNSTIWDLSQYASNPLRMTFSVQGITAFSEMNVVPEEDPNDPWYIVGGLGYSQTDASGSSVLLKSTSGSSDASIDQEFSYHRVEPYLTNRVTTDTEAKFKVESGMLGAGDAHVVVRDATREARLATLLYSQSATARNLVTDLPQVSLSGLQAPVDAGWLSSPSSTLAAAFVRGQTLEYTKTATEEGTWYRDLAVPTTANYEGLISEARLSVESGTVGTLGVGFLFGAQVPTAALAPTVRTVGLLLTTDSILLVDNNRDTVATIAHVWNDLAVHTYRLVCDPVADIVVLSVDDTVVGSTAFSGFVSFTGSARGFVGAEGTGVCAFTLHSTSAVPLRPLALAGSTLGRTFGILTRDGAGTPDDIDSYKIPRADSSGALNSSLTAIPVQMDWQSLVHVRLYLDPTWGVCLFRPDLALPPTATGDFATETTDPSAAWATVEYSALPVLKQDRGTVHFGAPDPRAVTQQRWDFMRYRIRGAVDGFGIAPQGMVLNRSYTVTSGELLSDTTPTVSTITSRTSTLVYIPDSAMYASRVFVVQVDGATVASTTYGFDSDSQNLIFSTALPAAQYPVTVTFAPGRPVSKTYLCTQPIDDSVTILNEGTPPIPKSRDAASTSSVFAGSKINDPLDILDDAEALVLNDPYRFVEFADGADALYGSLEFCEKEDGDSVHLSSLCDGPGPGEGLSEIGIAGLFTTDAHSVPGGPGGTWGKQSPTIKGSASHFAPTSILMASGGGLTDGLLGTAIAYPNARGPDGAVPPGGMGMNQDFRMVLADVTPRAENLNIPGTLSDNVPPSAVSGTLVPNGTPGTTGNGAAAYEMTAYATTTYSKLGPWGGLTALSVRSLLAGGAPYPGTEFILSGGLAIMNPVVTTGVIQAAN